MKNNDKVLSQIITAGNGNFDDYNSIINFENYAFAVSNDWKLKQKRVINCAASASITYQQAGLIDAGKLVSHTAAVSKNIISHYDTFTICP